MLLGLISLCKQTNVLSFFDSVEQKIGRAARDSRSWQGVDSGHDAGLKVSRPNVGVLNGRRRGPAAEDTDGKNFHPTVKPIGFNKWLAKLLLPP